MTTQTRERLLKKINEFYSFPKNSDLYTRLLKSGINQEALDFYIESGHQLKQPEETSPEKLQTQIDELLDAGGMISGGAALSYIFKQHETKDVDIYFNDDISFMRALLSTRSNPYIDVCFYRNKPYEFHDLAVSRCSVSKDGQDVSDACQTAMDTRVCGIFPDSVIWPMGTVRRLFKYSKSLGMKYKKEQIISFCVMFRIEGEVIGKLLDLT